MKPRKTKESLFIQLCWDLVVELNRLLRRKGRLNRLKSTFRIPDRSRKFGIPDWRLPQQVAVGTSVPDDGIGNRDYKVLNPPEMRSGMVAI